MTNSRKLEDYLTQGPFGLCPYRIYVSEKGQTNFVISMFIDDTSSTFLTINGILFTPYDHYTIEDNILTFKVTSFELSQTDILLLYA